MDWYERAWEACQDNHEPEQYGGREWDELTDDERDDLVMGYWPALSDGMRAQR